MLCSLIGAFLLVYVAVITFMNILGYPLGNFMLVRDPSGLSLKKIYSGAFVLQLIAMFMILEEGHITTLPLPQIIIEWICLIIAILFSIITFMNWQSHCIEKRNFMAPLLSIITLCFWFTLFNA